MIYSHKNDIVRRNLSRIERDKLARLRDAKPTAWMIDSGRE